MVVVQDVLTALGGVDPGLNVVVVLNGVPVPASQIVVEPGMPVQVVVNT
jgi:hypothetical protein